MKIVLNNNGVTMIELLAVVTILGIMSALAVGGYSRYKYKSIEKSYNIMSENAATAAEEYFLDHETEISVDLSTLIDESYLEKTIDPINNGAVCTGTVYKSKTSAAGKLDTIVLDVKINCTNRCNCTKYPNKNACDSSHRC